MNFTSSLNRVIRRTFTVTSLILNSDPLQAEIYKLDLRNDTSSLRVQPIFHFQCFQRFLIFYDFYTFTGFIEGYETHINSSGRKLFSPLSIRELSLSLVRYHSPSSIFRKWRKMEVNKILALIGTKSYCCPVSSNYWYKTTLVVGHPETHRSFWRSLQLSCVLGNQWPVLSIWYSNYSGAKSRIRTSCRSWNN